MKILFVTDGTGMNYTRDSVMHGFLDSGYDVVDTGCMSCMSVVPGRHRFTIYGKFPNRGEVNREDIVERIRAHEFDFVVFGHVAKLDYFNEVITSYDRNHVIILNGRDINGRGDWKIFERLSEHAHLFIREIYSNRFHEYIHPISYAVPEGTFCTINPEKIRKTSLLIPGDLSTYVYDTEEEYYLQYQQSQFAFTAKKGGWDCLRHYEIISQKCLPVFIDIGKKPKMTMTNWPIDLQEETTEMFFRHKIDEQEYGNLLDRFFNYAISHFTTKCLIKYMFNSMLEGNGK